MYAHSSFSSSVQSLLPKDTLLKTYSISIFLCRYFCSLQVYFPVVGSFFNYHAHIFNILGAFKDGKISPMWHIIHLFD